MKDYYKGKTLKQLYGKVGGMIRTCKQCDAGCEDYEATGCCCYYDFDFNGVSEAIKELREAQKNKANS